MKKVILLMLVLSLTLSLTACGKNNSAESKKPTISTQGNVSDSSVENNNATQPGSSKNKILIAYFSRVGNTDFNENVDVITSASLNLKNGVVAGNTEVVADMIHKAVGGDLFLIKTAKKYPVDYDVTVNYGQQEQKEKARPELSTHVENMEDYDVVFIGFPMWWYDMPMPVYKFLEEYDFSGKTVIPFTTHEGSGLLNSEQTIKSMLNGATVLGGFAVRGGEASGAQRDVDKWLQELGMSN